MAPTARRIRSRVRGRTFAQLLLLRLLLGPPDLLAMTLLRLAVHPCRARLQSSPSAGGLRFALAVQIDPQHSGFLASLTRKSSSSRVCGLAGVRRRRSARPPVGFVSGFRRVPGLRPHILASLARKSVSFWHSLLVLDVHAIRLQRPVLVVGTSRSSPQL